MRLVSEVDRARRLDGAQRGEGRKPGARPHHQWAPDTAADTTAADFASVKAPFALETFTAAPRPPAICFAACFAM